MSEGERLLIRSGENISNLITLMTLHEENVSRHLRGLDVEFSNLLLSYLNRPQSIRQCIYQNIISPINTICPITQELFQPNDEIIMLSNCGHVFQKNSILIWLNQNSTCPCCRTNVL